MGKIPYSAVVIVHVVALRRPCSKETDSDALLKSRQNKSFFVYFFKAKLCFSIVLNIANCIFNEINVYFMIKICYFLRLRLPWWLSG